MTTYYVDTVLGDDANAGTAEGAGNAWATIDKAMNTVAAADKVWVKASGNYNETATIDTAGAAQTPIVFEGYSSITGDNGKVTIDGQSTRGSCIDSALGTQIHYVFKNFICTNGTGRGVWLDPEDDVCFMNCEFNNHGIAGVTGDDRHTFVNCVFANNASHGADVDNNARFIGCISYGNGSNQLNAISIDIAYRNVCYGIGANDSAIAASTINGAIIGNTIDGENAASSTGLAHASESNMMAFDNILYDLATGLDTAASPTYASTFVGYNLVNSNTTDYETDTGETTGYQDQTSAPVFTDEANDDYTLAIGSAAIDDYLLR
jgi:hypothetical protein